MTLTIDTINRPGSTDRYTWRTGDDVADLINAAKLLLQYAEELQHPAVVAQMPQLPINTTK